MRSNILRFAFFYILWVVVVVIAFIFALNNLIHTANTSPAGADVTVLFIVPFVIMFGGLGAPWILFWILSTRKPGWARGILENGKQAPAAVLSVSDTGVSYGRTRFVVTLDLRVQPADEPAFETRLETTVSRISIPRPGDTFVVKYDPDNKDHLLLLSQADIDTGYGTPPSTSSGKDISQELTNLAQLHKSGDLSDAEYEVAKRKLLT